MNIEHVGLIVRAPISMARWYEQNLGFQIRFSGGDDEDGVAFLTDGSGRVMLELAILPNVAPLEFQSLEPLQLHIAVTSADPEADCRRLQAAGAVFVEKCARTLPGDTLLLLRDPWGTVIQLAKRGREL
jgi:uncharacterized glyoxalase superfamily protein PhnB